MTAEMKEYMDARFDRLEKATLLGAKDILDAEEAAMLVGLAKKTIYDLTSKKSLPHYKRNGKLYFKKQELEKWMTENKVLTDAEMSSRAETYIVTHQKKR